MTEKRKKKILSLTNIKTFNAIKLLIAILLALATTFVVICLISDQPVQAFLTILTGTLRKPRYIGVTIEKAIPYAFAGICCGILFKCGYFNLGAEGIFVMSGLATAFLATREWLAIEGIHPVVCIIGAAIVGGILNLIPAFMKAKFNANEMVLSLMLNSAYLGIATYVIRYHFLTPNAGLTASPDFLETARISYLPGEFFEDYHISACLFLLIVVVIIIYWMLEKTKLGYQIRLVGSNPHFAEYAGINSFKLAMTTNFIAGAVAGIGAAVQLLTQMAYFNWVAGKSPGIGFTGSLMAMLGQNNPIATTIASFCIKYLEQGAAVLYFTDTTIPSEIVAIVEGIVILFISSKYFLKGLREKKLLEEGLEAHIERSDR